MRLNFVEGWKIVLHDSSYLWRACLHFLPGVEHWPLLPKCNYCNPLSPNLLISLVLLCLVEDDNALHKDQVQNLISIFFCSIVFNLVVIWHSILPFFKYLSYMLTPWEFYMQPFIQFPVVYSSHSAVHTGRYLVSINSSLWCHFQKC